MKKLLLLPLAAIVVAGCHESTGGKVPFYNSCVWANESDHQISLSLFDGGVFESNSAVLQSGESFEIEMIYHNGPQPPVMQVDAMTVLFDDGQYGWTFGREQPKPENYDSRYDPTLENNFVQTAIEAPEDCPSCKGRSNRWTYTFTNADYEAAKEYGPRPEGRK